MDAQIALVWLGWCVTFATEKRLRQSLTDCRSFFVCRIGFPLTMSAASGRLPTGRFALEFWIPVLKAAGIRTPFFFARRGGKRR